MSYARTLSRVETYFDKTATRTWERLTSDAPVSRIRETVRRGRDEMRAELLGRVPLDMRGLHVLDAGCGAGQMTQALVERGAKVTAVDISPALIDIAKRRLGPELSENVTFIAGDMLAEDLGGFDHVIAMDSLIYYSRPDLAQALLGLHSRTRRSVLLTVAPRTPLLMAMWRAGQLFPRSDRSPTMVPHAPARLARDLKAAGGTARLEPLKRVSVGFYISQAMELAA